MVYTNDLLNRTTQVEQFNGNTLVKTYDYQYDLNGNRSNKTETLSGNVVAVDHTYIYDRENRLEKVTDPNGVIFTSTYDYRTRRITKTENNKTTTYLYDGGVSCQEIENGQLAKQYIRGNGMGGGIGSVLYMERAQVRKMEP